MSKKITLFELHPDLAKLITAGGSKLLMDSNTVTITTNTPNVAIGVSTFNKDTDQLMVFINSVFINKGDDYTVNSDNTISPVGESIWSASETEPTIFNFIVLKNVTNMTIDIKPDGSMLLDNSVQETKLSQAVRDKLNTNKSGKKEISLTSASWTENKAKGLFVNTVSHNLNTEVANILAYDVNGNELYIAVKKENINTFTIFSVARYDCKLIVSY